jgi:magnesium chelatase family protein
MVARYQSKISGPLLDRIDLNIKVKPVDRGSLVQGTPGEGSEAIARRVLMARQVQMERFDGLGIYTNAQMDARQIREFCPLGVKEQRFMEQIMEKLSLSARGYGRIVRLSRTIADMMGC